LTRIAVVLLVFLAWLPEGSPALGQVAKDKIAAIDVQRIYRESAAAKALRQQLDKRRAAEQDQLRAREKALFEADKELRRQRTILSSQIFSQKNQDLAKQVAALNRDVQNHNKTLKDLLDRGISKVQKSLIDVVSEIATERGLDLVITAGSVVLQNPQLDITEEAMARLNDRLPTVPLEEP
jgi:Skp family chaperone for outer membrane proteins